ncbi:MAG: hypothetical protein ACFFAJ_06615 [Candidatus Hodarchaeota archaeon]
MPRPPKTRACNETEKKKAEIFYQIDDLIISSRWDEALESLHYLYWNSLSIRSQIVQKFAWLYFEMKNPKKSLAFPEQLIPTENLVINRMILENLIQLNDRKRAIYQLSKTPLSTNEKKKLLNSIIGDKKRNSDYFVNQIAFRCSKCTRFLFFIRDQPRCLFCDERNIR